jgi:hypothetical protein
MWATTFNQVLCGDLLISISPGRYSLFFVSSRSVLEKQWSSRKLNRRHVLLLHKDNSGRMNELETLLTRNGQEKDIIIIEQHARARDRGKPLCLKPQRLP